jgi:glycosyltransferase involved in cell wall biosynthesis
VTKGETFHGRRVGVCSTTSGDLRAQNMKRSTNISVIMCTYNRAKSLAVALEHSVRQVLPQSVGYEILVVDNNSSDETPQVVEHFRRQYPDLIRYLRESKQGLSHARNAGICEARGEVLAFVDDDEAPIAYWLQILTANLHSGEWAGSGGPVIPDWQTPPPRWWSSSSPFTLGPLAAFDPQLEAGEMNMPPVGANMAFRKEMFELYGGFRADLGRIGSRLLANEDIEFGRRLMAAGHRLRYEPLSFMYHPVTASRVRKGYFLLWWFNKGRCDTREEGVSPDGVHLLGVPIRLFRDAAVEVVRWVLATEPSQRFICRLKIWAYAGSAFEFHCRTRDARRNRQGPGAQPRGICGEG